MIPASIGRSLQFQFRCNRGSFADESRSNICNQLHRAVKRKRRRFVKCLIRACINIFPLFTDPWFLPFQATAFWTAIILSSEQATIYDGGSTRGPVSHDAYNAARLYRTPRLIHATVNNRITGAGAVQSRPRTLLISFKTSVSNQAYGFITSLKAIPNDVFQMLNDFAKLYLLVIAV